MNKLKTLPAFFLVIFLLVPVYGQTQSAPSQEPAVTYESYYGIFAGHTKDQTFWNTMPHVAPGNAGSQSVAASGFRTGCSASGGCDEYISRVQAGSIDNSSECLNYADYTSTQSTDLPVNGILHMTVTNGHPYSPDQCGVWVDWNRNGSFYDEGEQIEVEGQPGYGPYTARIIPLPRQTTGSCTMRVRITYSGVLDPCGVATYGEVEDYTINCIPRVSNVWTGASDIYWNNPDNWSLGRIPTKDDDVTITSAGHQPATVAYFNEACQILKIESGELSVTSWQLDVNGSLNIYGKLSMIHPAGVLNVYGNVTWFPGSTAGIIAASTINAYGNWTFEDGADAQLLSGIVQFKGNNDKYIKNYSAICSFNNLASNNSDGAETGIHDMSTHNVLINGFLHVYSGSVFTCYDENSLIVKGDIICEGKLKCFDGTIVLDGINQNVTIMDDVYFNNLTISASGTTSFNNPYSNTLTINGSVSIESGVFNPMNSIIEVAGNWTNYVGPSAFTEGIGKVVFNGTAHQYCTTETFNDLEVNKSAGAFRVEGGNVTCNSYDWTAGAVDILSGTFTANALADNAIVGNWYLNAGGTINIYQGTLSGDYVDIGGNLNISGGTMNVYGGALRSYWPYSGNASITMSGGILDFKTVGILLYDTPAWSLTVNITGGVIRTAGGFYGERGDYTPASGTLELYGPGDCDISTINGCTLNDVSINKTSLTQSPSSNTAFAFSDLLTINSNLTIQSGTFQVAENTVNVAGNCIIYGNLGMNNSSGILQTMNNVTWKAGSTASIEAYSLIKVYKDWYFNPGANVKLNDGMVMFLGGDNAYIKSEDTSCYFHILGSYKSAGSYIGVSHLSTAALNIHSDIYVHPGAAFNGYSLFPVILKGNFNNHGHFLFDFGTFVFNGTDQYVQPAPGDYFNNLTIARKSTTSILTTLTGTLLVNGNLIIEGGVAPSIRNIKKGVFSQ